MGNLAPAALSTVIALLLGQVITAVIFLIGFVPLTRRALDKEIPAALADINGKLGGLERELEKQRDEIVRLREAFVRFSADAEARMRTLERHMEGHG